MDPRSTWALGEFREARLELCLPSTTVVDPPHGRGQLDDGPHVSAPDDSAASASVPPTGSGVREGTATQKRRVTYQGERLSGVLVVSVDAESESEGRRQRWKRFGRELSVELEITTEAVASTGSAFASDEPSLWRDYEGRETARDRGVLSRCNRIVTLNTGSSRAPSVAQDRPEDFTYTFDFEVHVPVEHLGQAVVLEALVSPASLSQTGLTDVGQEIGASSKGGSSSGTGGSRRDRAGGDFASRLDGFFALSRIPPVRLPVRRCVRPLHVVQPIAVTSRSSIGGSSGGGGGGNRGGSPCLVALEVRNDHPFTSVTLHDVDAHVDATARLGERASSLGFSAPGKAMVLAASGGRVARGPRRRIAGGMTGSGCRAALEGLEGAIEQPPSMVASKPGGSFSRVFAASWVGKPSFPLRLASGDVHSLVLSISPIAEQLPPRHAGDRLETPITFVWSLDGSAAAKAGTIAGAKMIPADARPAAARAVRRTRPSRSSMPTVLTSVHLAQWQSEPRARDEVLLRVKGKPRVKLNSIFEVSLRVRNLSPGARELVVMFTEDGGPTSKHGLLVEGLRLGTSGGGGGSDGVDSEDEGGDNGTRDISPSTSPTKAPGGRDPFNVGNATGLKPVGALSAVVPQTRGYANAATSLGDLVPVDAAVPLGRLERGSERATTVRLTAARTGLAQMSSLCVRDTLTGAVYTPAQPYEVFVES